MFDETIDTHNFVHLLRRHCILCIAEAETEDKDHVGVNTAEDVPCLCASVSDQNEKSENKTSVSTEGPDSSEVMTPDSCWNVDAAVGADVNRDSWYDKNLSLIHI